MSENTNLQRILETKASDISNLETKCKYLEESLKNEKKKNKKESQKGDKKVLDEPKVET